MLVSKANYEVYLGTNSTPYILYVMWKIKILNTHFRHPYKQWLIIFLSGSTGPRYNVGST